MARLFVWFPVVMAALAVAPAAFGDGATFAAVQGGPGLLNAAGTIRYVAVPTGANTVLEAVDASDGVVADWSTELGSYGLPALTYETPSRDDLSVDGKTLILSQTLAGTTTSKFLVIDTRTLRLRNWAVLRGSFAFDALSPDASRLYLIEYTLGAQGDYSHYVVRAYDLRTNRLLPGRIADRTQKSWVMAGYPLTRTSSAGGRFVYTLYQNPGGYPFIHALDTVKGVAHCIGLPWTESSQNGLANIVLSLRGSGRTLVVHWRSGRRWLHVSTSTWRVTPDAGGLPWRRFGLGAGLPGAVLVVAGFVLLRRRRLPQADGPSLARAV